MQKIKRKEKIKFNKKNKLVGKSRFVLVKKRWGAKKKTFSPHPYIITASFHRKNIFFTLANIEGQTKLWTSSGRLKFKGRDKTTFMAVLEVSDFFFRKLWRFGRIRAILILKNARRGNRFAIRKTMRRLRKRSPIKFIGFFMQIHVAFNGCRKKKKRWK
jgi:ribosomal protein S11